MSRRPQFKPYFRIEIIPEALYQHRIHDTAISAERRLYQLQMASLARYCYEQRCLTQKDPLDNLKEDQREAWLNQFLE
ncbi:MAG: hypothetical protein ACPGWR_04290, partial [Ardenticatenaceae bacterium]